MLLRTPKGVLSVHWKDWCWSWNSNISATWCEEELTHLKRPWCWKRLKAEGEGDDRRWDGWMASPTRWTWVWVSSGSWWWTGKPGMLQSMGSQRVGHDWVTELNWTKSYPDGINSFSRHLSNSGFVLQKGSGWGIKIPWTEEPGGLQSMRSQRVGKDLPTKQQHLGPQG